MERGNTTGDITIKKLLQILLEIMFLNRKLGKTLMPVVSSVCCLRL